MQYNYFRTRSLDKDEYDRRRASLLALLYIQLRLPIGTIRWARALFDRPYHIPLVEQLVRQLIRREAPMNPQVLGWALAYTHPAFLRAVIKSLRKGEPASWAEKVLKYANEKLLLPCEYLVPDFQRMRTAPGRPKTVLVCFTGMAQRLNMPVQLFHCVVAKRFDVILYLRDHERQRFVRGVPGFGADLGELATSLQEYIPDDCHLSVLGTSGGGVAATRVAEILRADRLALFSPGYRFKDVSAVSGPTRIDSENALLYFSAHHNQDKRLVREWQRTTLAPAIRLLDTELHGTLSYIANAGHLEDVITWLLGGPFPQLERFGACPQGSVTSRYIESPD